MQLFYNNIDITKDVKIIKASISDNCGGIADSISLLLSDTDKLWRQWGPQKNDRLVLNSDRFTSGLMYIDEMFLLRGKFSIKAISTPLEAKTRRTRAWENISFKKLAADLAEEIGLSVEFYSITDWIYDRLEQLEKTNLEFLNERCILEGYNIKATNGKIIIYEESQLESANSVYSFDESSFIGEYSFECISSGLYSASEIKYFAASNEILTYKYTNNNVPVGPVLRLKNLRVSSIGEAERYARNLLKYHNKNEVQASFTTVLNNSIAASNTIQINGIGSFSGKYFVEAIRQDIAGNKSHIKARKSLEGYL